MKAKLYKGPFNGKVYTTDGRNDIVVRGPKPMTRKQKYEHDIANYQSNGPFYSVRYPVVEARYKIVMRPHQNGYNMSVMPCMHPDGSIFYEYVDGSKKEFTF